MLTISSITNVDATLNQFVVDGIITPSGNYGTVGGLFPHGDQLVLSATLVSADQFKSNAAPTKIEIWATVTVGAAPQFDFYVPLIGATAFTAVVQIIVAGAEMAPGAAYAVTAPTNAPGYVMHFRAWFPSFGN